MNEDKASRYHRLKRQASVASLAWTLVLLAGLAVRAAPAGRSATPPNARRRRSGASAAVAGQPESSCCTSSCCRRSAKPASCPWPPTAVSCSSAATACRTSGCADGWSIRSSRSALGLLLGSGGATILYALIRYSPERWWLPAGAVFALLIVLLTNVAPVLLLPLFYRVKPLDRESLRARLVGLAERAGARVLGAYEWGLGEKTKKANAALAGLGATRRILVSDTMLAEYSDEEIEVVLAHELAHHVHGDIWKGIRLRERADSGGLLPGGSRAGRAGGRVLAARRGRHRRPAAAAAGGRRRVARDGAGGARDVARVRAERRSLRARPDAESRRRSSRRCAALARRTSPKSIRRGSCSGCSTATRRSASASPPRRPSRIHDRRARLGFCGFGRCGDLLPAAAPCG